MRELEQALLEERIDLAVHSLKDLPAILPEPFRLAAVPAREDARDALLMRGAIAEAAGRRRGKGSSRARGWELRRRGGNSNHCACAPICG